MALLSAADPSLATLGPVGFYLANKVGSIWLLVIGLGWPVLLGITAWVWGLGAFRRRDLV